MTLYRSAGTAVPQVPAGTVVELGPDDWAYSNGRSLRLRVHRVRYDLAWCYGGEQVWVEGWVLTEQGASLGWKQALVNVSALSNQENESSVG